MSNVANKGNRSAQANLNSARNSILSHHREKNKKKKDRKETESFIEKLIFDSFKTAGKLVIQ